MSREDADRKLLAWMLNGQPALTRQRTHDRRSTMTARGSSETGNDLDADLRELGLSRIERERLRRTPRAPRRRRDQDRDRALKRFGFYIDQRSIGPQLTSIGVR